MIEAGADRGGVAALERGRGAQVALGAFVLLAAVAFWPSITALAELWSDPDRRTYQHGYLLAAVALVLLFRERRRLIDAAGRPVPVLLAATAAASLVWAIAWNAGLQALHFLLWPLVLWAAATGTLGWRAGRILLAPIGLLYFAMPGWELLTPLLQYVTAFAVGLFATAVGMPVLIDGTYVHIPEGSFEIAGGCSGLNFLVVGLALAALLGELNRDRPERRLLLLVLGGSFALVCNWLRVFIIVYAGHVSDMTHYLVRVDHYNFGWMLYAVVLAVYFQLARRLPAGAENPAAGAAAAPRQANGRAGAIVAATAAILVGPVLAGRGDLSGARQAAGSGPSVQQPVAANFAMRWQQAPPVAGWLPVFPGADTESMNSYSQGEDRLSVYLASYVRQSQGRELIGHGSHVEGQGAGMLSAAVPRAIGGMPGIQVLEAEWQGASGASALIWWTYRVGTRDFASGLRAQLWYGLSSLWSAPASAVVALRAECRPDCARARATLTRFAADALPELLVIAGRPAD